MSQKIPANESEILYDIGFVERLFDEMSDTYEKMNYITSFGFSARWRWQFVKQAKIHPGMTICDLMCGMGECWGAVAAQIGSTGRIVGIDLSTGMLRGAIKQRECLSTTGIDIVRLNVLDTTIRSESIDVVISGFGLKTFSPVQLGQLAAEVRRILKPGGRFSLIEVSVPSHWLLRTLYMFYLKQLIPILGWLFLGNPENYRMLGIYTERFHSCRAVVDSFQQQGFHVEYHSYFFGCASGISGRKE